MRHNNRWVVALLILIIVGLHLSACALTPASRADDPDIGDPARVERIGQTNLNRVILTADASKRLDIQTAQITDPKVVPYAAMFYDLRGTTWVYTNPAPLTFVRQSISVDSINGDRALLSVAIPIGTKVVIVGAPELYGTEFPGGLQP
jgi:hypothetical protein